MSSARVLYMHAHVASYAMSYACKLILSRTVFKQLSVQPLLVLCDPVSEELRRVVVFLHWSNHERESLPVLADTNGYAIGIIRARHHCVERRKGQSTTHGRGLVLHASC